MKKMNNNEKKSMSLYKHAIIQRLFVKLMREESRP